MRARIGCLLLLFAPLVAANCGSSSPSDSSSVADAGQDVHSVPVSDASTDADSGSGGETDAGANLRCTPRGPVRVLAEAALRPDETREAWGSHARVVRLGPKLVRVVVERGGNVLDNYSFDPTTPSGKVDRKTVGMDTMSVLELRHEDGAFYAYVRGGSKDDAGTKYHLALISIDDATSVPSVALLTPLRMFGDYPTSYEPPMGRFFRFGPNDVYFTYTEEIGDFGNPSYHLWVARQRPGSGLVTPQLLASRGPHHFQEITATGLAHDGANIHFYSGGSGRTEADDSVTNADRWILPDDGGIPADASVGRLTHQQLLTVSREPSGAYRFAFLDPPGYLSDQPGTLDIKRVEPASLGAFTGTGFQEKVRREMKQTFATDAHFEGDQLLVFGPRGRFWLDTAARRFRAVDFEIPSPSPGVLVPIQNAAITFAAPPTDSGATFDIVYTQNSPSNIATLYYGGVTCEP